MTSEQTFTLSQAAEVCGVSLSTIRRKRSELRKHGAVQSNKGWKIPASALIAAGLPLDTVNSPEPVNDSPNERSLTPREYDLLTAQIADWRKLYERERDRADRLEERLDRLLPSAESEIQQTAESKKGFFSRLFGI